MVYPDGDEGFKRYGGYRWTGGNVYYHELGHLLEIGARYYDPEAAELADADDEDALVERAKSAAPVFAPGMDAVPGLELKEKRLSKGEDGLRGEIELEIKNAYGFIPKGSSHWYTITAGVRKKRFETMDLTTWVNIGLDGGLSAARSPFPGTDAFRDRYGLIDAVLREEGRVPMHGAPLDLGAGIVAGIEHYRCTCVIDKGEYMQVVLVSEYSGEDLLLRIREAGEKRFEVVRSGHIFEETPEIECVD
jgi:hypothetical protein